MVLDLKVVGVLIRLLRKLIVVSAQPISIDVSNIRTFTKKLSVLLSFMMFKNPSKKSLTKPKPEEKKINENMLQMCR